MVGESKEHKQRRARLQLSCQPCRIGKLKCSRELPCEQCTKRSRETSCVYTTGAQESISFKSQAKAMREKLENLEKAVQHFKEADQRRAEESGEYCLSSEMSSIDVGGAGPSRMHEGASSSSYSSPFTPGHLINTSDEGDAYIGPSHWQSIINDIAEVKSFFEFEGSIEGAGTTPESSHAATSPVPSSAPDVLLRVSPSISKETLLYSVPPRHVADRLVAAFFGSMDIYKPIIHLPTFQKQYQQFWQRPESTPAAWLALLFSVFALGLQYTIQAQADKGRSVESNSYLELAAHAINLADYTKPKAYTIEGLILSIRCRQMQDSERQFRDWLTMGLVTRICIRMGYHRDPSHYNEVSAFDGEMRRRVWLAVCFLDVTMSYQIGLISSITNFRSNVALPRNLHDSDFGPATVGLPNSRPPTDFTQMSHSIHIGRILPLFSEAVHLSHSPEPPNLQQVYAVANKLQQVMDEIPPPLVVVPPEQALVDSPDIIIKRFGMELLAQKTICVLFRRYLGTSEIRARKACVEAALRSLGIQKAMEEAKMPGGPLCNCPAQQWWDLMDTFLLGGIIIALELSALQRISSEQNTSPYSEDEYQSMTHLLQISCNIWQVSSIASEKSKRAAKALERVLHPQGAPLEGNLLDAGRADEAELQDQWPGASGNPLQTFDVNSLAATHIAPYPPASGSPPMQMEFSLQGPMNIDWVSSRLPYFE